MTLIDNFPALHKPQFGDQEKIHTTSGGVAYSSTANESYRFPPYNLEAEQALLGAILVNNEALDRVASFLNPFHFFDPMHGEIYEVASKLIQSGKPVNPVTLKTFFENSEPIDESMTVPQYLGRLAANATTIINAYQYGRTIYDLAVRRQLIVLGEDMVNSAYDSPVDQPPEKQIEEAESRLYAIASRGTGRSEEVSLRTALSKALDRAAKAYERGGKMLGLSTGLADLDARLGGLQPSDLIILAGRPSMGKTALGLNIAKNVARAGTVDENGEVLPTPVHVFSLEMSDEQLASRILAEESGISSDRLRRGNFSEEELRAAIKRVNEISSTPLIIDQTGGLSIGALTTRARRIKRQHKTSLIVVDYLQLMQGGSSSSRSNRTQEITEITMGLKALAKELDVPVIALSQLSRETEKRSDKRPQLSDLRESGSIEQDADIVMFVYRDDYYLERTEPDVDDATAYTEWQSKMARANGTAEVIIAKHRHGKCGTVELSFEGQFTRFSNLAREDRRHG